MGKYHVNATFFVVGDWVAEYPESVKALADTAASTEESVTNCCTSCATDIVNVCYGRKPVCPANKI